MALSAPLFPPVLGLVYEEGVLIFRAPRDFADIKCELHCGCNWPLTPGMEIPLLTLQQCN